MRKTMTRALRQRVNAALGICALSLTASCGGDSGSSVTPTPSPTPSNHAPAFTSATTASIIENSTATFYTPAATDADGDAVTFAIGGGTDADKFKLAGGALAFSTAPNFDQPSDANTDNIYDVILTATDAKGGSSSLSLAVKVTNDHEGVAVTRVATGLGIDAVITARSRVSGLIAVSQDGSIRQIDAASGAVSVAGNVFKSGESGRVLGVSDYGSALVVLIDINGLGVIVRVIPPANAPSQTPINILLGAAPSDGARGALFVSGGGLLLAGIGDSSGDRAQDASSGYGKLFHIDVDPFCGASAYVYCVSATMIGDGLHAPASGGAYQGQSFLLDRGTDRQEEVDYFNQLARPLDFGWPYREGTFERATNPPAAVNGPSLTYDHGTGFFNGTGLTGGALYSGSIASLSGDILLTDESGKIFAFPARFLADGILHKSGEMENRTGDFAPASGAIERPVSILVDYGGRLFVLDGDGELFATN